MTVAFGVSGVPGTLPITVYEPGAFTSLWSAGAGQITRTSPTIAGSRGSIPTVVSTVMSGTRVSRDANGHSFGIASVGIGVCGRACMAVTATIEMSRSFFIAAL